MARIAGVDLPKEKRVEIGLTYIYGIGVTSLILLNSKPAVCKALIAASLPEPGPFTNTSTVFNPCSIAALAAVSATCPAA